MKITIEISDQHVPLLSRWASISRTLDNAELMACTVVDLTKDDYIRSRAQMCIDELTDLKPAVDHMHRQVRNALWQGAKNEQK